MTHPGGGSGDINLAALWIPIMPETSHLAAESVKIGRNLKRGIEEGFNSGASPEAMGSTFGSKLATSISKEFKNFELPFGASTWVDRMSGEIDQKLVGKLKGEAASALQNYRGEYEKLTEAQGRSADAENKLNIAREGGFNKASIMMPLIQQQAAATRDLEAAHTSASVALNTYHDKTQQLHEAQKGATDSGTIMAGMMGGLMVVGAQLAVGAIEKLVEGVVEGFKASIEITTELVKKTLELGETYEHIGIQIHEFSAASGTAFEEMEVSAQRVFSTLDVAGQDVGKTMSQFASILNMEPGPALELITKHVTELQGRFTSLKAADLASIFVAFKVPAEEADSALASLLHSARDSGQDLGALTAALSGSAAITLQEAGLNIQQAGAFMGELLKMGAPGRQVMTGMSMAMKEFGLEGLSFSDGMKLAATRLRELGDTAEGQNLAEKLFGGRNWAVAMKGVEDYLGVVEQGPDAFNQNSASIEEFLHATETLGNVWETVKHKAEDALRPIGTLLLGTVSDAMRHVGDVFATKHDEIIGKVREIGHSFIDALPDIKNFAETVLRLFGAMANPLKETLLLVTQTTLGLADVYAMVTGNDKLHESIKRSGEALDKLEKLDITKMFNDAADGVHNFDINTQGLNDSLDHLFDKGQGAGGIANWWGTQGSPGAGNGPHGGFPSPGPGAFPAPGPASAPGSSAGAPTSGPQGEGHHNADWDAIAGKESSGVWNQVLSTGITLGGGLQIKPDTWYEFGGLAYAQYPYQATKDEQIAIAERILNGWGTVAGQGPKAWQNGANYVERKVKGGAPVLSGSGQGDDVPALLGKGEYVWDTETVDKYGWLIKALHNGSVRAFDQGGGLDTQGAQVDTIAVAEAAKSLFGITDIGMWRSADGYNEHASGEAADVMVGSNKAAGDAVAQYFLQHAAEFGVQYVLWQQAQWNPDGTHSGMPDRGGATQNHLDHVHVRTLGGGFPQGQVPKGFAAPSSGATSNAPSSVASFLQGFSGSSGGTIPGGQNGPMFPGMPGQYGGSGVYGGETLDQQRSAEKAVQQAQDRASDLDYQIQQNQRRIDDLKGQIAQAGTSTKIGPLTGQPLPLTPAEQVAADDKRKQLNAQLDDATHALTVSQRERAQQDGNITDAQRKQQESMYKKPSGTGTTGQSADAKLGQSLGSGFLAGIGQELGFGDVLGKSPLEWGVVKLFGSLFGYANSLGDAVSQATGGGGGVSSGGGGSGLLQGLTSSLGFNLPKAAGVSSGPNIAPGSLPIASGQGTGPAPGPVVQGDYMPINVSPNVDPRAILGPVQEQRNSDNASLHGQTGGLPQ